MTDRELLPCPFCGAEAGVYEIAPHSHSVRLGDFKMPDHPGSAVVECGCGSGLVDDTREAVMSRWNARPSSQDGCRCHACHRLYRVDLMIPDEMWREITPGASGEVMLCGACIMARLDQHGFAAFSLAKVP